MHMFGRSSLNIRTIPNLLYTVLSGIIYCILYSISYIVYNNYNQTLYNYKTQSQKQIKHYQVNNLENNIFSFVYKYIYMTFNIRIQMANNCKDI